MGTRLMARMRETRRLAEERGSQTAEYAMLGGVGAAACATLIALLKNKSTLGRLVEAVFEGLAGFARSWF